MACIGISENGRSLSLTVRRLLSSLGRTDIGVKLAETGNAFDILLIGTPPPQTHSSFSAKLFIVPDCMDTKGINSSTCIITYGLRKKNAVTASSLIGSRLVVSVQRSLPTLSGEVVAEQELIVNIHSAEYSDDVLGIVSLLLAIGIPPEQISALKFDI